MANKTTHEPSARILIITRSKKEYKKKKQGTS